MQPAELKTGAGAPYTMHQYVFEEADLAYVVWTAIYPNEVNLGNPRANLQGGLDNVAKKYGFANYPDYNTVVDNISLVLGGIDPATKKYVGTETVIKAQIAQVTADKKMPAKDKKDALADLNEALKQPQPAVQNKGNIDLVLKYYDKLSEALGNDQ